MLTFVDTSALIALLDRSQAGHAATRQAWEALLEAGDALVTSNYILVEATAVLQNRHGVDAVRDLDVLTGPCEVLWIEAEIHAAGLAAVLASNRRDLSLVDCTSFELMRRRGIEHALTLDDDFARQGFEILPG